MKNGIYYTQKLDKDDIIEINALEKHCSLAQNMYFKIDPQVLTEGYNQSYHILYYVQNALKGYASLNCFDGEEQECTIIVENDENIFDKIYNMILQKARERKLKKILFVIDTNDAFLVHLIKRLGFQFSFAEYRMSFEESQIHFDKENNITIEDAVCNDMDVITYLERYNFGKSLEIAEIKEVGNLDITNIKIAKLNGEIIGKLKVEDVEGIVGIYGFVVDPKWRGKGLGRKIMHSIIKEIFSSNLKKLYLEVDVENSIALHLYKSVGFHIQAKFDYYEYEL